MHKHLLKSAFVLSLFGVNLALGADAITVTHSRPIVTILQQMRQERSYFVNFEEAPWDPVSELLTRTNWTAALTDYT